MANKKTYLLMILALLVTGGASLWTSCSSSNMSKEEQDQWKSKGKEVIGSAAGALKSQLMGAISDSGLVYAVNYCNLNATGITDSITELHGTTVGRTALKTRNKNNKPSAQEKQILMMFQKAHNQGDTLKPVLVQGKGEDLFYYHPIMMQPLCLNCHGNVPANIKENTFNAIKSAYPNDKAMEYSLGDFRGMWTAKLR